MRASNGRSRADPDEHSQAEASRPLASCAVGKQEMLSDPAAIVAMESEWNSLRKQGGKGLWDETLVREYRDVQQEAWRHKKTVHFGRLFELCFEMHRELPRSLEPSSQNEGQGGVPGQQRQGPKLEHGGLSRDFKLSFHHGVGQSG